MDEIPCGLPLIEILGRRDLYNLHVDREHDASQLVAWLQERNAVYSFPPGYGAVKAVLPPPLFEELKAAGLSYAMTPLPANAKIPAPSPIALEQFLRADR